MRAVQRELAERGTYELTAAELEFGARTAWRNAARCPARVAWRSLTLADHRHIDTAAEMWEAIKVGCQARRSRYQTPA